MVPMVTTLQVFLCYVLKLKQIALLARRRANNDRQAVISASHIRGALKVSHFIVTHVYYGYNSAG